MEVRNAKIESTFLGFEDHGIFTFMIQLDYGGSGQGFGQYSLNYKHYGIKMLEEILNVVGVKSWEELRGKLIRVEQSHEKVHRIGNILEDKWFDPETLDKDNIK